LWLCPGELDLRRLAPPLEAPDRASFLTAKAVRSASAGEWMTWWRNCVVLAPAGHDRSRVCRPAEQLRRRFRSQAGARMAVVHAVERFDGPTGRLPALGNRSRIACGASRILMKD